MRRNSNSNLKTSDPSHNETPQQVCEWCLLPKFGETQCICDNPRYIRMGVCDGCGEWTDVDKLFCEQWDSDDEYCHGCFIRHTMA